MAQRPAGSSRDARAPLEDVAQSRVRSLVDLNRSIVAELTLAAVLRRAVDAARTIARAQYAALGVLGPDGRLEQFIHAGMDEDTVAAIGDLPRGRGVLGALVSDPHPIRLSSIAADPRSSGFPAAHPPMTSFLGVPIQSRGEIYGNLYLTNRIDASEFTADDEELVQAVAATAGVAVENARLYEESRRQQEWLRASAEISRQLLQNSAATEILTRIADVVLRLAAADVVTVVFPGATADEVTVQIARGEQASLLLGYTYPAAGSLAVEALTSGHAVRVDATDGRYFVHLQSAFAVGPVMACPLVGEDGVRAVVMVGRAAGSAAFSGEDLRMAEAFASHAAIALELSDRREGLRQLAVLEDRHRIARDLHDHVIQRLFATGLSVQAAAVRTSDHDVAARLQTAVEDMDDTIRQIRTSIFGLQESRNAAATPRSVLVDLVSELEPVLGFAPDLRFAGPVDTVLDPGALDDATAVVREGLTNVAKHSDADQVSVSVSVSARHITIEIVDNGSVEPIGGGRPSGLANLTRRASLRSGALTLTHDPQGTTLRWTAALGD
jgi:signal transduction histidine kinase